MKVSDTPGGDSVVAYVITGNGRAEYEILPPLAKKYNGKKTLLFQKTPIPRKITGLKVLRSIKVVHKISGYTTYLILLDREHFTDFKLKEVVSEIFREYKIEGDNPYLITVQNFRVILVILGDKKCIEENIAHLILLEFNERIEPEKGAIRKFLRESKIKKRSKLIEIASKENLEIAFNSLVKALKMLE